LIVGKDEKAMIFVNTKRDADFIASLLCQKGLNATSIHGDRQQQERELALGEFHSGTRQFLVATAVAARGLGQLRSFHLLLSSRNNYWRHIFVKMKSIIECLVGLPIFRQNLNNPLFCGNYTFFVWENV
jgi:hypothetical protein